MKIIEEPTQQITVIGARELNRNQKEILERARNGEIFRCHGAYLSSRPPMIHIDPEIEEMKQTLKRIDELIQQSQYA